RNLALGALGCWLVNQDAGVRKRCTLARCACSKQNSSCRCSLAQADSLNVRTDITHGVVDSHQRGKRATWRVDVHGDVAVWVHALRTSSCAMMSLAEVSSTWVPRKIMRSSKSLEYGLVSFVPCADCSINDGST